MTLKTRCWPQETPSTPQTMGSLTGAVCSVQCAVCSMQCTLCSVQCAICSVHCTVMYCTQLYSTENYRCSSAKNKENFTNSASSTLEFMFKLTNQRLRGEGTSNMNSGLPKLKLHRCTLQTSSQKPSLQGGRELANKVNECSFNLNVNKDVAKYPMPRLQGKG